MRIKAKGVSKNSIVEVLLIYLLLTFDCSFLYENHNMPLIILVFAITGLMIGVNHFVLSRRDIWIFGCCVFLFVDYIFICNFGSSTEISRVLLYIAQIFIAYVAVTILQDSFVDKYVKVVYVLAWISLAMMFVSVVTPDLLKSIMVSTDLQNSSGQVNYGMFLYVMRTYVRSGMEQYRNVGIYTEPGRYQLILNIAVFYMLNFPDRIQADAKKKIRYLIVLVVTIISAQSTIGYGILAINLLMSRLANKKKDRSSKKIDRLIGVMIVAVIVFVVWDYIVRGDSGVIANVIVNKLFDANVYDLNSKMSGTARLRGIMMALEVIKQYPLGAGTTHLTEILNHYIAVYQYSDFAGAALLKNCAIMGTLQLGSVLVFLFVKMKQKLKNTTTWICVLLIFVLQSLSSSYVFYPSIFAMAILNLNNMSKLKEVN